MRPFLRSHDQRRRSSLQFNIIQDQQQQLIQQQQQQQQQHIRVLALASPGGSSLQSSHRHPIVRSDSRTVTSFFENNGKSSSASNRKLSLPADRMASELGDGCCHQTNVIRRQRTCEEELKSKMAESGTCLAGLSANIDTTDNQDLRVRILMTGVIITAVVFLVAAMSFWIRQRA
ncbi:hypothetical protein LSH36_180g00004 [Paralvinella palmiformis]|uniref:Uncharacterized protein n=1 Tax=Paralvinella palmiformis TaxID=53620 RepID=A0AAD9JS52_9ANNE|nr:hypothetical protein LSH36_180g00004 [Paralvinella palmiformis]